ncbi:MAG: hypothetical protein IPM79_33800 [Polyangiaceae bacterium]|jgi:hypothetical protein|nr:hypothetical protein [Polyangiaceae bacterium]MBK8942439.1 hypothetical protein [Polyangiaceae bacterium]
MTPARSLGCLLLALGAWACSNPKPPPQVEQNDEERGRILIVVTVDWEGRDLTDANIGAMEELRARRPDVPLVQYLNAAYFTKPDADPAATRQQISRALSGDDELGLHIHGWERLFEAAGVTFRASPTFWDPSGVVSQGCSFDCGHEVPISAYTEAELDKVIGFSLETLEANGLGRAVSFRAGGWMAKANVRDALVGRGFLTDGSAVPSAHLASEIGDLPLWTWVDELWKGTDASSQPFQLATAHGPLLEIPDNGALADYMTAQEMVEVFQQARDRYDESPREDVVVSIGFHQETAAKYLSRVDAALDAIVKESETEGVPIRFVTAAELATR